MIRIAPYLKEIGRGRHGARALPLAQAVEVFAAVLDRQVTELELGGFLMAMRIKAESVEELIGFTQVTQARCIELPQTERPALVLPSYNGSRRLPNLTPLLAGLLAQQGIPVLVHGPLHDPNRVSSAEIFESLAWGCAHDAQTVENAWNRRQPAFASIESLCPPLARVLALRWVLGVRSSGHSVAKLLNPFNTSAALRVVNYTHPEYTSTLTEMLIQSGADAMLLRGTEGEPVADPRRQPRMDVFLKGQLQPDLCVPLQEGPLAELPALPTTGDAASTAEFIQRVLRGELPVPVPIKKQVDILQATWTRMGSDAAV